MKKSAVLLLTGALLSAVTIYSCGIGDGGNEVSEGSSSVETAKTATLNVSALFPKNGEKGRIGTAIIDQNTASIKVNVYDSAGNSYYLELTPDNPSGSISGITVGTVYISIDTYDSANNNLDHMYIGGNLAEGQNNLVATLIRGNWQFVDSNGNPTQITLNGTMATAQDTVSSFSIIPGNIYPATKSSIDEKNHWGDSVYPILWKGSNLDTTYNICPNDNTACFGSYIFYFNQFIGPNSNNNAVDGGDLELTPDSTYPTYSSMESNRFAFLFGIPIGFYGYVGFYGYGFDYSYGYGSTAITFPDESDALPTINGFATTSVTGADTMTGNIVEVLLKDYTYTVTCYDVNGVTTPDDPNDSNVQIQCPTEIGMQSIKKEAVKKAIINAMANDVGKAQNNNCYTDLSITGSYQGYAEYVDLNSDGIPDPINIEYSESGTIDACFHPFTAKATQLPQTDLNITIQNK